MQKIYVDQVIAEYTQKIFGFALSKTQNIDKAEELAARITFDVYNSLLKADAVHNINGYIWRVACHVYARFVDEEVKGRSISLDEVNVPSGADFTENLENDEDYLRLRRQISYLGKTQRDIVVMHYFDRLKQGEIAKRLKIPLGTVKWHLHDARKQIREGFTMNKQMIAPIEFSSMGHDGNPGPEGKDTSYYLAKRLAQNVAYAAYWQAKSISEIAETLGVPAAFVEDEVAVLEDNGFMDKQPTGKYLTNIFISQTSSDTDKRAHELYVKYAEMVCEQYVPLLFDAIGNGLPQTYTPHGDINFLRWLAVVYACRAKLRHGSNGDVGKYIVARKDGGAYIACAAIGAADSDGLYSACGDMTRKGDSEPVLGWSLDTYYDSRTGAWRDNWVSDYENLYRAMTGKMTKTAENAEAFQRLYSKGYLVEYGGGDMVNMVVTTQTRDEFENLLPAMPSELAAAGRELDSEIYALNKPQYPPHMQELCRIYNTNCLSSQSVLTRALEILSNNGTLAPLSDEQKMSVNTIMFSDVLPG
ncbi:MAG: sigma-70 family RNA polymerase sigma factor [Oscillospiraceae bacterium]|nr:sigma-70 family RNA polymerase sigma factor [Oscillospiraceae bacterium]